MKEEKLDSLAIFRTRGDHVSWDKYIEQIDLIDLNDDEKRRAKNGMQYLRKKLGEDFLRHAVETGNQVFGWFFANAAPHARRSLVRLAEELKSFEGVDGFKGLADRLKDARSAEEALTVLGVASSFSPAGFSVAFDPNVKVTSRVSDLVIVDPKTDEEVYVEVSRLRKGGQREINEQTFNRMFFAVHNAIWQSAGAFDPNAPKARPYVQILKPLSDKDLSDAATAITKRIFDAARTDEYLEYKFKDSIEMAVSPPSDHSKAEAWAADRGMTDFVEAPPINVERELKKAIDKIHDEIAQIPPDKPGIIAIPTSENLLFFFFSPQQIVFNIADEIRRYPNLLCVILFHSVMEGPQEPTLATSGEHA
ncbi:MAG TPA: hypothetical protein VHQ64_09210, partial [Pyrinomonadaceae bacterium]|nr:hypothetical protein [Pyrinomonadaceae bacterium]